MTAAIEFRDVDIIFGENAREAQEMARAGKDRAEILSRTGAVLGATGANLTVNEGEISVLMGLSGSGKSTLLRAVNGLNKVTGGEVLVKDGSRMVDVAEFDVGGHFFAPAFTASMRSRMMASTTMARPASMPKGMLRLASAL